MNNLSLQPLKWFDYKDGTGADTVTVICEYTIYRYGDELMRDAGEMQSDGDHDSWVVAYYNRHTEAPTKEATGFATIDEAKAWAWKHYNEKMQPHVKPTTLADAVNMLVDACYSASVRGGWWHDLATGEPLQRNKLEMVALIHSEVSEAVEGIRKGINDDHLAQYPMEDVEMADALIRIFDYIGGHKLQTADALVDKLAYNANRADHKPENRIKDGGKKY